MPDVLSAVMVVLYVCDHTASSACLFVSFTIFSQFLAKCCRKGLRLLCGVSHRGERSTVVLKMAAVVAGGYWPTETHSPSDSAITSSASCQKQQLSSVGLAGHKWTVTHTGG